MLSISEIIEAKKRILIQYKAEHRLHSGTLRFQEDMYTARSILDALIAELTIVEMSKTPESTGNIED